MSTLTLPTKSPVFWMKQKLAPAGSDSGPMSVPVGIDMPLLLFVCGGQSGIGGKPGRSAAWARTGAKLPAMTGRGRVRATVPYVAPTRLLTAGWSLP